jgi:hypothetical protein
MNVKWLGGVVRFVLVLSVAKAAHAQIPPTPEEFDRQLKACASTSNIGISATIIASITRLFSGETSRQALRSPTEFLLLIPEDQRVDAYRLYAECITKIVPQIASTAPSPSTITTTYKVCTGEYERACLSHDTYLYCNLSVEDWAKGRCTSYKIQRLNTYGGNKCGYSLDEVICTGPK